MAIWRKMIVILLTYIMLSGHIFCYGCEFQLMNKHKNPLWIGIQGNKGKSHLNEGGVKLQPGERKSINAPDDWSGKFWPRTDCNPRNNHCATGDCGNRFKCQGRGGSPPACKAEVDLDGNGNGNRYDVSLEDGFNIPVSIEPVRGKGSCKKASCSKNLNSQCPNSLKHKGNGGETVGCKSACSAFNTDEYCCRGKHGSQQTCKSANWPTNYAKYFKDNCPDANSYKYDEKKTMHSCNANSYLVTFG